MHVLVEGSQGARDTPVVKKHRTTVAFPRGSFVKVAPSVLVSSPELLFLQMAKALAFGEMVALGFELCGLLPAFRRAVVVFGALAVDDAEPPVGLRLRAPATTMAFSWPDVPCGMLWRSRHPLWKPSLQPWRLFLRAKVVWVCGAVA